MDWTAIIEFLTPGSASKIVMVVVLFTVIVIIYRILIKRDADDRSRINLEELLLDENGKMSKPAAVMFGAFSLTTWLMVYLALSGKMSEAYIGLYLTAWVAPAVTRLIVQGPVNPIGGKPLEPDPGVGK